MNRGHWSTHKNHRCEYRAIKKDDEKEQLKEQVKVLKNDKEHLREQLQVKDRQIDEYLNTIKDLNNKIEEYKEEIEQLLTKRCAELNEEVKRLRKRKQGPKRKYRTEPERRRIAKRQNWLCAGKGCEHAVKGEELEEYDIDHIIPLTRGGTEDDDNLQALCPGCHRRKTDQERLLD